MPHEIESLSRRTLWNALGSGLASAARLVASVSIARILGPSIAGEYAYYTWIAEFGIILASFGLPSLLTRFIAEKLQDTANNDVYEKVKYIQTLYVGLTLAGGFGVFFISTHLYDKAGESTIGTLVSLLFVFQMLGGFITAILSGQHQQRTIAKINFIYCCSLGLLQPLGAFYGGLHGALLGTVLAAATQLLWWRSSGKRFNAAKYRAPDDVFVKNALYTWLASLVSVIVWARTEVYFLKNYSTSTQAGLFSASLAATSAMNLLVTLITGALMPHFSRIIGMGRIDEVRRDYQRFTTYLALATIPLCAIGMAVSGSLYLKVFGARYVESGSIAAILLGCSVLSFANVGSAMVYAFGGMRFIFLSGLCGALVYSLVCYLVAPMYGAIGIAKAKVVLQLVLVIVGAIYIKRKIGVGLPYQALLRIALLSFLAWLGARLGILATGHWFFASVTGAVALLAGFRWVRPLDDTELSALARIIEGMPSLVRRYLLIPVFRALGG